MINYGAVKKGRRREEARRKKTISSNFMPHSSRPDRKALISVLEAKEIYFTTAVGC